MPPDHTRNAPSYPVPNRPLLTVHHPCIVQNVDNALRSLESSTPGNDVTHAINYRRTDSAASSLHLLLNPDDKMSRPIVSTCTAANNVVLKVTVPKRTGRKRKRGSGEPFREVEGREREGLERPGAKEMLRSLRDNKDRYEVEAVGKVDRAHVFRGMPDFAFSTVSSPFLQKFRENILPFDYEKLKNFDISMGKGETQNVDVVPPPTLSRGDVPFSYMYRQNLAVKQSIDQTSGQITTINIQQPAKILTHLVPFDIPVVPSAPHPNCPSLDTADRNVRDTVETLRALFETRAAWTRRALRNSLVTIEQKMALRLAIPYVAYVFRSGPWRDAIVRFGYDPRLERDAHIYQTFMFRILAAPAPAPAASGPANPDLAGPGDASGPGSYGPVIATTAVSNRRNTYTRPFSTAISSGTGAGAGAGAGDLSTSHIFTGRPPLYNDGKIFMVCDITDPILVRLLYNTDLNHAHPLRAAGECDVLSCGWYGNVTHAVAKVMMRAKIQSMSGPEQRRGGYVVRDEDLEPLLGLPSMAETEGEAAALVVDGAGSRSQAFATEVRAIVRGSPRKRRMGVGYYRRGGEGKGDGQEKGDDGEGGKDRRKRARVEEGQTQEQDESEVEEQERGEFEEEEEEEDNGAEGEDEQVQQTRDESTVVSTRGDNDDSQGAEQA